MSAVIAVTQNKDLSWTAKGSYGGIYAEATAAKAHEAVAAISRAFEIGKSMHSSVCVKGEGK